MSRQTPEGVVRKEIREYLRSIGAYFYAPVPNGYGASTVDILVCWRGRFYGIEVKRPDTRPAPTPRQQTILDDIAHNGGGAIVAYSLDDVRSVIAL